METPKMLETPELDELKELVKEYIDFLYSDEWYEDNDYHQYIFEKTIEAFYGKNIFKELNKLYN